VLAVPGSIFCELSVGPNTLIGLGARPVLNPSDVIDAVGGENVERPEPGTHRATGVLAHLPAGEAWTVDELAAAAGVPVARVLHEMLELEVAGRVERQSDGRYARVKMASDAHLEIRNSKFESEPPGLDRRRMEQ
jgi:DNA processing protein